MKTNINILLNLFFVLLLSIYVLYEQAESCADVDRQIQIERHERMMEGNSEFYNPWQYRVLSHWILQGLIIVQKSFLPSFDSFDSFYLLRLIQLILIFSAGYLYFRNFSENNKLVWLMLLLAAYNFSNSTFMSDLAFNTYFDILFYAIAGILIFNGRVQWIVLVTIFAAFNRETSAFIPVLTILFGITLKQGKIMIKDKNYIFYGSLALLSFVIIFFSLRFYYGFRPAVGIHGMTSALDYLKYNLSFVRLYPLLLGTLGIVPLLVLLGFKRLSFNIRLIFWVVIPAWFLIHFLKSTVVETRLFLVPQFFVFIPALLYLIEKELRIVSGSIILSDDQ